MSDLERRLAEALRDGAQDAPRPVGLAAAARSRAQGAPAGPPGRSGCGRRARRRRPRGRAWPRPVTGRPRSGSGRRRVDGVRPDRLQPGSPERLPRRELARREPPGPGRLGLRRPLDLVHRGQHPGATPVVERPGVVLDIACSPPYGYGVSLSRSRSRTRSTGRWPSRTRAHLPDSTRAWAAAVVGDVWVEVVATEPTEAQAVLDSATVIDDHDLNGCAPQAEGPAPTPEKGTLSVCRYDGAGALEQSELLEGDDAEAAAAAIAEAPETAYAPPCAGDIAPAETPIDQDVVLHGVDHD